jgi:hypothetical protein
VQFGTFGFDWLDEGGLRLWGDFFRLGRREGRGGEKKEEGAGAEHGVSG